MTALEVQNYYNPDEIINKTGSYPSFGSVLAEVLSGLMAQYDCP